MKKGIWIITVIFLFSCSGNHSTEKKKQQLVGYKEKVVQLNLKIKQLEEELSKDTSGVHSKLVPVKVETLQPASFDHYIEVFGVVKPVQEAYVSPEINGQVDKIYVSEGDRVKRGDLLIRLDSPVTESSIAEAKTQLNLAKALYNKQKKLWDQGIGSEVQYLQNKTNYEAARERLKTLQAQLDMSMLRAPFDGVIDQILIKEGELASPGRQLVLLLNPKKMKIYGNVPEQFVNDVHEGDPARVKFPDLNQDEVNLTVYRTGLLIDEKNRNFQIECRLDNMDETIKPNQFSLIRLNDFHSDSALTVPTDVIKQDLTGYFLYKIDQQNGTIVSTKTYVKPGMFYNNRTVIEDGLKPDDRVVIEGYNQISNGQGVRIID